MATGAERSIINRLIGLVVLAAAFTVPLVFMLGTNEAFQVPKSATLEAFGACAAFLLVLRRKPLAARSLLPGLLFLGAMLPSLLRTPLLEASAERLADLASMAVLAFAAESAGVRPGALVGTLIASHFLTTLYGGLQVLGLDWITWSEFGAYRVYSTSGNPDFLGSQTSLILPLTLGCFFTARKDWVRGLLAACFALALPSIFYTQGRGAFLSFIGSGVVLAVLINAYVLHMGSGRLLRWLLGAAAAIALILVLLPFGRHFVARFTELGNPAKSSSVATRLFYWHSAWEMTATSPMTGTGLGAYHLVGPPFQAAVYARWEREWPGAAAQTVPHLELYAHNDYVQVLAETGIIGLGAYLWLMVSLIAVGLARVKAAAEGGRAAKGGGTSAPAVAAAGPSDRWLAIGLLTSVAAFFMNGAMNFPFRVVCNAQSFVCVIIPALLAGSTVRPSRLSLPGHRLFIIACFCALVLATERPAGKLVAGKYLKNGHVLTLEAGNPKYAPGQRQYLFTQSLGWYDQAWRMRGYHTDHALVALYKGMSLRLLGRQADAIAEFDKVMAIYPLMPNAWQQRGIARMEMAAAEAKTDPKASLADRAAGTSDLERAAALGPGDTNTWWHVGTYALEEKRYEEALHAFERVIRFSSDSVPDAHYALALCYARMRRFPEARAEAGILLQRNYQPAAVQEFLRQLSKGRIP